MNIPGKDLTLLHSTGEDSTGHSQPNVGNEADTSVPTGTDL